VKIIDSICIVPSIAGNIITTAYFINNPLAFILAIYELCGSVIKKKAAAKEYPIHAELNPASIDLSSNFKK
jgi:hypothetical protein